MDPVAIAVIAFFVGIAFLVRSIMKNRKKVNKNGSSVKQDRSVKKQAK